MKIFDELTNRNFKLFAIRYYNNPECTEINEFAEDVSRFKYVKRLFTRYEACGDLQERLILNHLIIIYNVFGIEAANKMMWFKVEEQHYPVLKTFLLFLNYLKLNDKVEIPIDQTVAERLRKI
jgi:hypothetical protein